MDKNRKRNYYSEAYRREAVRLADLPDRTAVDFAEQRGKFHG